MIQALAGGGGGGGGGYSGEISNKISSGGTNRGAFGSINFGDNAKVGGTSAGDAPAGSNTMLYVLLGAGLLVFLLKR